MKATAKRLLSLLLCMCLLFTVSGLNGAYAADDEPGTPAHDGDHVWGEWDETKTIPATCSKEGDRVRFCTITGCTAEDHEAIEKEAHTYNLEGAYDTLEATHENNERHVFTCTVCESKDNADQYVVEIPDTKIGDHQFPETGWTDNEDGTCSAFCTVLGCTDGEDGAAFKTTENHTVDVYTYNEDATCYSNGTESGVCTRCGATVSRPLETDENRPAHSFGDWEDAKDGVNHTRTCTLDDCDASETEPHTYPDAWTDAEDGVHHQKQCEKCEYVLQEEHDWKKVNETAPTCTEAGSTAYECETCGATKSEPIDPIGHDFRKSVTVAPTCEEEGYTLYVCANDMQHTEKRDVLPAEGHKWNEGEVTRAATCEQEGVKTYTCTVCGETKTEGIPATDHDYDATTIDATCEEAGYTEYVCKNDASHTYRVYTDPLGHDYRDTVTVPTCVDFGYTTHTCSRCSKSYVTDYTAALDHNWNAGEVTTEPGCTTTGIKTFTCSRCRETKTEVLAALGHAYDETITAPTCEKDGITTYVCSRCSDTYTANETDALGHAWNKIEVTTEPGCLTAGVRTYTCTRCGATKTESIDALGHKWNEGEVTTPTCQAGGYTTFTCGRCGTTKTALQTEKVGHEYDIEHATYGSGGRVAYCKYDCGAYIILDNADGTRHLYGNVGFKMESLLNLQKNGGTYTGGVIDGANAFKEIFGEDYTVLTEIKDGVCGTHCVVASHAADETDYNFMSHSFTKTVVVPASCTSNAKWVGRCEKCGFEIRLKGTPASADDAGRVIVELDKADLPEEENTRLAHAFTADEPGSWKPLDANSHYKDCIHTGCPDGHSCSARITAEHTFGEYVYNEDAKFFTDGTKSRTCTGCGYVDPQTIPANGTSRLKQFLSGLLGASLFFAWLYTAVSFFLAKLWGVEIDVAATKGLFFNQ